MKYPKRKLGFNRRFESRVGEVRGHQINIRIMCVLEVKAIKAVSVNHIHHSIRKHANVARELSEASTFEKYLDPADHTVSTPVSVLIRYGWTACVIISLAELTAVGGPIAGRGREDQEGGFSKSGLVVFWNPLCV